MNSFVLPVLLDVVSGGMLVYFLVGIAVIIVVFLILREIACWYWKINERIALMQEQNELLRKLVKGSIRAGKVKGGQSGLGEVEETEAVSEPDPEG